MPIPPFNHDGIIPPFIGAGPAGPSNQMSPHQTSAAEVATTLGLTMQRINILYGWLDYREELRNLGFGGFQWLDGSFVEQRVPRDMDVVTFLERPPGIDNGQYIQLVNSNLGLFDRAQVKARYMLDAFPIDLGGRPETIVNVSSYFLQLFSHRRDQLWKGMLKLRFDDPMDDAAARQVLTAQATAATP